jgi:hypothetical protein
MGTVVLLPPWGITVGCAPPDITARLRLVVPKSIPIIFSHECLQLFCNFTSAGRMTQVADGVALLDYFNDLSAFKIRILFVRDGFV